MCLFVLSFSVQSVAAKNQLVMNESHQIRYDSGSIFINDRVYDETGDYKVNPKVHDYFALKDISTNNAGPGFEFEDDGGGSSNPVVRDGSSFDKAILANIDTDIMRYTSYSPVYYEFTSKNTRLSISNVSGYRYVDLYLYDSTRILIDQAKYSTTGINALDELTVATTYYLKIVPVFAYTWSRISLESDPDCMCLNMPYDLDLLFGINLVNDSTLSISYYESTKYDYELSEAIRIWNDMNIVSINQAGNRIPLINLHIYDASKGSEYVALTNFPLNEIILNDDYYLNMTQDQRIKTLLHELGHALGMNEFNISGNGSLLFDESTSNVMRQGIRSLTSLGSCDKYMYYWLWE
jgi:hypothetical protein